MSLPEREPALNELSRLLKSSSELSGLEAEKARLAFLRRAEKERSSKARSGRALFLVLPAVAAAALALVAFWPQSLAYSVSGAKDEGGYVKASPTGSATIRFSDRTEIALAPNARLRVAETETNGARVLLERGGLRANVFHGERSRWNFVAGPFDVRVTGTRFDLSWDASEEVLDLTLIEGSVEVQGLAGTGPVAVRAGQSFHGDARRRTMLVRDSNGALSDKKSDETSPPNVDSAVDEDAKIDSIEKKVEHSPVPSPSAKSESWTKLMAQGKFSRVVSEAEAKGFAACLNTCDAADLRALADAARYTGKSDLGAQSLLALRKRFATTEGRGAAFLLGRLSENLGKKADAETWYATYLRESPTGSFASEALAGRMRMVSSLGGKANAAPIAREYLTRYPTGVHAPAAKEIAGQK